MPISLETQTRYDRFSTFADNPDENAIALNDDGHIITATKSSSIGNIFRSSETKGHYDAIRKLFSDTIVEMCGASSVEDLPPAVKKEMKIEDYGQGKPLTARRIRAVKTAVDKHLEAMAKPALDMAERLGVPRNDSTKSLVMAAVKACIDDKDVLEIVTLGIRGILYDNGTLRTEAEIANRVAVLTSNVVELRQVAGKDGDLFFAGKKLLTGIGGTAVVLPRGAFRRMVDGAEAGAKALGRGPFAALIQTPTPAMLFKAVDLFSTALREAGRVCGDLTMTSDQGGAESDEEVLCRNFVAGLMMVKYGKGMSVVHEAYEDLSMNPGANLKGWCQRISAGLRDPKAHTIPSHVTDRLFKDTIIPGGGIIPDGRRLYEADLLDLRVRRMDQMLAATAWFRGNTSEARATIKASNYLDVWPRMDQFCEELGEYGTDMMARKRGECLRTVTTSSGTGADLFRYAFARKIDQLKLYNPAESMNGLFQTTVGNMLRQRIIPDSGRLAGRQGKQIFEESKGNMLVRLPGGTHLSNRFEEARNQIAALITHNQKTDFNTLTREEQSKVYLVLSLVSQEVGKVAFKGPALALSPQFNPDLQGVLEEGQIKPAFDFKDAKDSVPRQELQLDFDRDTGLTLAFRGHRDLNRMDVLTEDGTRYAQVPLEAPRSSEMHSFQTGVTGSAIDVSYSFRIGANALDRLSSGSKTILPGDAVCDDFTFTARIKDQPGLNARSVFPYPWTRLSPPASGEPDPLHWRAEDPAAALRNVIAKAEADNGPLPVPELKDKVVEEVRRLEADEDKTLKTPASAKQKTPAPRKNPIMRFFSWIASLFRRSPKA